MYTIIFSEDAKKDLKALSKKAPQALPKLSKSKCILAQVQGRLKH